MKGSIHFESKFEISSKFTVSIPLYQSDIITNDYPTKQIANPRNILSTEINLHPEMSNIPNEFSETHRNLFPHVLEAKAIQEEESKLFESVNPLNLGENSENSR